MTQSYICIAGPTASGKTAVALEIARHFPVEIISVDSALVYRGLDIGSAKPTVHERTRVPHHLIDIREPCVPYSAADFVRNALQLIGEITARGRIPLLVGGTMLYFKSLIDGLDELPAATPEIRSRLDAQAAAQGWPALHAELSKVDPVTAQRLSPNDAQRIQRALEVWMVSGKPLSAFFNVRTGDRRHFPPLLSLEPENRSWLHQRIALRFAQMLDNGFIDEVRTLMRRGDLNPDLPSMRAVGYRQVWAALTQYGMNARNEDDVRAQVLQTGVAATRQLAKRQITWLRAMDERFVVHGDDPRVLDKTLEWMARVLARS